MTLTRTSNSIGGVLFNIRVHKRHGVTAVFLLLVALVLILTGPEGSFNRALIVDKSEVSLNKQGLRMYLKRPFTGEMVSYYQNRKIASSDQFIKGRREGHAKKWFDNGVLGYESFYKAGKRDGLTRSWWVNGKPRSEFFYISGKPEGEAWRWYKSGAKFKRFNYKKGKPVGLQQAWRENGKLSSNFEYRNGRTYGLKKANSCVGLENEVITPSYYQSQANNNF
ncbi:toxin-antitoxin system YwqK family antitoxin [Paraglaciecola marina]|uniref:toxin-antitoxin system YwqK family antitoxin n=1 Tax=Paraglaciecola marina TaxID=2500157 RepID=UPI001EF1020A|nr:toxin-antitoxin system YwqK family antitoxin [Paraglaciecola marina]